MNTAEEMNDDSGGRRFLRSSLAIQPVCQKHAEARSRVGAQQEEDRLSGLRRLLDAQRSEDTLGNSVIQEQHSRRLHEDRVKNHQALIHQPLHTGREECIQSLENRSCDGLCQQAEHHTDNTDGEIVHQHLEAGRNLAIDQLVKFLNDPAAQGTQNHRACQHGNAGTHDTAHGQQRAHDTTTFLVYKLAAGVAHQKWQQIFQNRILQLCKKFIWKPASRYKHGSQETPGYKCSDIRQNHRRQKATQRLYLLLHHFCTHLIKPLSLHPLYHVSQRLQSFYELIVPDSFSFFHLFQRHLCHVRR